MIPDVVLDRTLDEPPFDGRAEQAVLSYYTLFPERVASSGLHADHHLAESDFAVVPHRWYWWGLERVAARSQADGFYPLLLNEFAAYTPDPVGLLCVIQDGAGHDVAGCPTSCWPPIEYWIGRLKACAEARKLLSAAQHIANRAWMVPERAFGFLDAAAIVGAGVRAEPAVATSGLVGRLEL